MGIIDALINVMGFICLVFFGTIYVVGPPLLLVLITIEITKYL